MRKQFDLEYYLEHPDTKVVTRDGRSAIILCTDFKNEQCQIIAAYNSNGSELVSLYHNNGLVVMGVEHNNDLFFEVPDQEKKKVPLTYEDLLDRVNAGKTMWIELPYGLVLVTFINDEGNMVYGDTAMTPQKLMDEELYFVDGDPCWKEVEE